ncbi:aftiphilin a isoform X1 [Brienomyrus brachyistius]|uniref:aftiphilin a isoform X1 n=1 Tax=Brienomyrus brachyistius TaxID=42636 RepID=UPI0020B425AB|nr:aftiphilin a isoform X1 [Brienomyrus brachyistius]
MEPEAVRMYSSSPPPLDEGAEDDDDEFGDFGGFSGVPSSVSFTEFDTPATFGQSQSAADTSPPSLFNNGGATFTDLGPGPFGRGSMEDDSVSSDTDVQGADSSSSWDGPLPGKTAGAEDWKKPATLTQPGTCLSSSNRETRSGRTAAEAPDCNGGIPVTEVLTNGFTALDVQEAGSAQSPVHPHKKGSAPVTPLECRSSSPADEFADFSAFSSTVMPVDSSQGTDAAEHRDGCDEGRLLGDGAGLAWADSAGGVGNTGAAASAESTLGTREGLSNGEGGSHTDSDFEQRDVEPGTARLGSEDSTLENGCEEAAAGGPDTTKGGAWPSLSEDRLVPQEGAELRGAVDDTVSSDRLEDSGENRTGPASSPTPCRGQTPSDSGQPEEDDEDFGDFGDATTCGHQGFANFDRAGDGDPASAGGPEGDSEPAGQCPDEEDFGEFNSPKDHGGVKDGDGEESQFADFPASDSFADFSSAPVGANPDFDTGWNAFGEQEQGQDQGGDESWAAFGPEQSTSDAEESEGQWQGSPSLSAPPPDSPQTCRRASLVSLASRLERLFQVSFPDAHAVEPEATEEVISLQALLEPPEKRQERSTTASPGGSCNVWQQLQDIHNAFGLRHQWGGSHSNKTLLCSLGIDTRNILFTGQKKQPVIVPMYAASLGMLEPTKEPVKPISAAEKIASIAQTPPVSPEIGTCPRDPGQQEALPPVQFDWSSSGLTNPLDASGGSSLLNLDFFGPVEDTSSITTTSIPGVDPELYELTTAKLDTSASSSRVADAFARLMSTVEKTSTSTRKPRKEEHLSEEAAKVISSLPDLSFMQAKVLMFPTTLTPLGTSSGTATPD